VSHGENTSRQANKALSPEILERIYGLIQKAYIAGRKTIHAYYLLGRAVGDARRMGLTYAEIHRELRRRHPRDELLSIYDETTLSRLHRFSEKLEDMFGGDVRRLKTWMKAKNIHYTSWTAIMALLKNNGEEKATLEEPVNIVISRSISEPEPSRLEVSDPSPERTTPSVSYEDEEAEEEEEEEDDADETNGEYKCALCQAKAYHYVYLCEKHYRMLMGER
jgi:hypothetical protein